MNLPRQISRSILSATSGVFSKPSGLPQIRTSFRKFSPVFPGPTISPYSIRALSSVSKSSSDKLYKISDSATLKSGFSKIFSNPWMMEELGKPLIERLQDRELHALGIEMIVEITFAELLDKSPIPVRIAISMSAESDKKSILDFVMTGKLKTK